MKLFTFCIFVIVSLFAYRLGRHDGFNDYGATNTSIQDIMSKVDVSKFENEEAIQKYVAEQLGIKPEEVFVEKVIINSNETDE